eukprot:GFUD01023355.1.p1 GENE.GFUD01023355.1~~GFUD01023355.1.p1  ORF type:complete len:1140 (-),score=265.99 GFUD01023355.1:67-3486(-)
MLSPPTPPGDQMEVDGPDSCDLFMEAMLLPTTLPRWSCGGKFSNVVRWDRLPESVISQGELERLVGGQRPVPQLACQSGIELFGIRTGLVVDQLQQIVTGLLQNLRILETVGCETAGHKAFSGVHLDLVDMEGKVAKGLAFLRELGFQCAKDKLDCSLLMEVVRELLLAQEKLCDLSSHISSQPATSSYFHTWLEVRWTLLSLCYLLPDDTVSYSPLLHIPLPCNSWLEQLIAATVLDMLGVAAKRYSSLDITHRNITTVSIFGCPCIEEVWYGLFTVCHKRDINFWSLLSSCCQEIHQLEDVEPDLSLLFYSAVKQEVALQPMFLSSFLSLLHASGYVFDKPVKDSIFKSLKKILKSFLTEMEAKYEEAKLRTFLCVISSVFSIIGPSLDVLDELWKFFSQIPRLNNSCRLKAMTLEGSTSIPSSSSSWLSHIQNLPSLQEPPSFMMFVQIAEQSLESWKNNCEDGHIPKEPKIFISRISLKINAKKLSLLNEYGVYHLGSLMLTLSSAYPDNQTPATTLLQMLQVIQHSSNTSSQLTVLKCCLTLCLLTVEAGQSLDISEMGSAVSKQVGDVVTNFATNQNDVVSKRFAQDNVKIYIEAVEDITDQSIALTSDEHILIQPWIAVYLSICSINEISTICTALNNLLTRARILLNTSPAALLETSEQADEKFKLVKLLTQLWTVVYPTMKSLSTNLTAPTQVSNLAADFVIQSAENTGRGGQKLAKESVEEMIKYFGLNKLVTSNTSAVFLGRLVHNCAVLNRVKAETGSHKLLLEVLALSCVHTGPANHNYQLVRNTWLYLAPRLGLQGNSQDGDQDLVRVMIEQLMNSQYSEVIKCMARECSDIGRWKGAEMLRMYQVGGWLAKHCAHILYRPGGPDPTFTNLIGNLLTPSVSFASTWILSGYQKKGLEQSLPDFILGLTAYSKLGSDKFISRKMSEIIRIYLPRFDITNHPLLPLLSYPPLQTGEENLVLVQQLTVNVVIKLIQENRFKNPIVTATCLKYFIACLNKPAGESFSLIFKEMMSTLLEIVTLTDDKSLKNPALSILQLIITKASKSNASSKIIQEKLNSFLVANLAFNSERVFQTLTVVSVMDSELVLHLLPEVEAHVAKIETKRGSGRDPKLQKLMENLKATVQNKM